MATLTSKRVVEIPTFIYNPGVQVYIEVTDKDTGKKRILDVSEDLVSGSLTRRVNGVSSFQFELQNPGRKYDYPKPIFTPMDRIIVNMKRVKWMRVFTGYLNQVPVFSVWPRNITLTASCSLKRLQYWWWDPGLETSYELILRGIQGGQEKGTVGDGGMKGAALALLDQVVGWKLDRVHIGAIPPKWFDLAAPVFKAIQADIDAHSAAVEAAMNITGGNSTINGASYNTRSVSVLEGVPIPATSGKVSTFGGNKDATTKGHSMANGEPIDTAPPYYCAMRWQYSNLAGQVLKEKSWFLGSQKQGNGKRIVVSNPKNGKVCIVRAADWGPGSGGVKEYQSADSRVLDLDTASFAYLELATDDLVMIGWAEDQTSGNLGPVINADVKDAASVTSSRQPVGQATGAQVVANGLALADRDRVPYTQKYGGTHMEILVNPDPPGLDCSSFIQWCYVQTLGTLQPPNVGGPIPRTVSTQVPWARKQGAVFLPADQAMKIPGAVMYNARLEHTEMAVGDGRDTVGAHHTGTYVSRKTTGSSYWAGGYLLPGVNYTDTNGKYITGDAVGATPYQNGAASNTTTSNDPTTITLNPSAESADIDKLFGDAGWVAAPPDATATQYQGDHAIQNDEPIFSYINNLMNASMRQWCSAPNGDIIAWFPDYFGVWNTAAVMTIEDVELQDFSVFWTDEAIVTHQFATGSLAPSVDATAGSASNIATQVDFIQGRGVASVEILPLIGALFGGDVAQNAVAEGMFRDYILNRFGARPKSDTLQGVIASPEAEFFMAMFLFMEQWAAQYQANMPLTFMPELFPGMLVRLPNYKFQAYVQEVTHNFSFGQSGSFTTQATVIAPTKIGENPLMFGLPKAQSTAVGHGYTNDDNETDVLNAVPPTQKKITRDLLENP